MCPVECTIVAKQGKRLLWNRNIFLSLPGQYDVSNHYDLIDPEIIVSSVLGVDESNKPIEMGVINHPSIDTGTTDTIAKLDHPVKGSFLTTNIQDGTNIEVSFALGVTRRKVTQGK